MTRYMCSQCHVLYTFDEYRALESQSLHTDDPNDQYGVESVCGECGSGFHSEKWRLRDEIETSVGDVVVSTVALLIPHGINRDQLYETCLFSETGNRVARRYETEAEAEVGHEKHISALKSNNFTKETTGETIKITLE